MGFVRANIQLKNPRYSDVQSLSFAALVDTGSLMLCVPQRVASQLKLEKTHDREVTLADGQRTTVPYVGPVEVFFENRSCFAGALVLGDEVLLGSVPMEDMDLLLSPAKQQVTVNPASPDIPQALVKGNIKVSV